jgi:hypothetical protein
MVVLRQTLIVLLCLLSTCFVWSLPVDNAKAHLPASVISSHKNAFDGANGEFQQEGEKMTLKMPVANIAEANEYQCTLFEFPHDVGLLSFKALPSSKTKVHHMTLHLCDASIGTVMKPGKRTPCGDKMQGKYCKVFAGFEHMSSGAAETPTFKFGEGMGVNVGPKSKLQVGVLEVHNNAPLKQDDSGFQVEFSRGVLQKQIVQDVMSCDNDDVPIPPHKKAYNVSCVGKRWTSHDSGFISMVHFHFHGLGTNITWWIKHADGRIETPAAQYQLGAPKTVVLTQPVELEPSASVHLQCTYDTSRKKESTYFGMSATDEMCNIFFAYYTTDGKLALDDYNTA